MNGLALREEIWVLLSLCLLLVGTSGTRSACFEVARPGLNKGILLEFPDDMAENKTTLNGFLRGEALETGSVLPPHPEAAGMTETNDMYYRKHQHLPNIVKTPQSASYLSASNGRT